MRLACKHFAHIQSFQATFDGLNLFHRVYFKAARSQNLCRFLRRKVEVDILFQPFV